jgi:2-polyprenyl-6-hydroxyphenyl methylase/3-demethylubiquinone-9 3-methyltransferase
MNSPLSPVCAKQAPCKCCGTSTSLFGVVDFHKNCEIIRRKVLDVSGIPIYYYRCPECKFIFTTAFDDFTKEDFIRYIYNEEYRLVDPDYEESRPRGNAQTVANLFSGASRPRRILDYGGGSGRLEKFLRAAGFPDVDTYDPFVPGHDIKPTERYECIVSFEVFEHTTDPLGTLTEMNELLTENGLILFSTLVQPNDIDQQELNWWYAGPRNGHVSLYSRQSLGKLGLPFGLHYGWFDDGLHVMVRQVPDFAKSFMKR